MKISHLAIGNGLDGGVSCYGHCECFLICLFVSESVSNSLIYIQKYSFECTKHSFHCNILCAVNHDGAHLVRIDNCNLCSQKTLRFIWTLLTAVSWPKLEKVDHVKLFGNPMLWRVSWNLLRYMDNEYSTTEKLEGIQTSCTCIMCSQ